MSLASPMAATHGMGRQVSHNSADSVVHVAHAESLVSNPDHGETPQQSQQKESPSGSNAVVQGVMLCLALSAYTFGPLLVNWSVVTPPPPAALSTIYTYLPAKNKGTNHFGVKLAYQPGMSKLYVEEVDRNGVAEISGILPGDFVTRGTQDGEVVFDQSEFTDENYLLAVKQFLEGTEVKPKSPEIDPGKPLTITFDMEHVDIIKGEAFLGFGLILMRNAVGSSVLMLIYLTCFGGKLSQLYTKANISLLILPGLGWTCADLFEVLANSKTSAALYSVLSQSRLVGTALIMSMLLGTRQSTAQITCLVSVTLVILCYIQVPDSVPVGHYWSGFGKSYDPNDDQPPADDPTGILYAFAKIGLSIVMGVVGQKALQREELKALPLVGLQALIWSLAAVAVVPLMLLFVWSANWDKGFFGGYPVEFRHCLKTWDKARCNMQVPVHIHEQGWDYRTVVVLFFYIFREVTLNAVLRMFDALTKNLVNSSATVSTYFLSLTMLGKQFNFAKCGLTLCIMLQIVQYALAPKAEDPPKKVASGRGQP